VTPDQAAKHLLARLSGDDAKALDVLLKALEELRGRQTVGGTPPPYNDRSWTNVDLPGGPDPEHRGL
jgi:hypothetical protein